MSYDLWTVVYVSMYAFTIRYLVCIYLESRVSLRYYVRYMCVDLGDLIFEKTYTTVEGRPLVGDPRPRQKCREALLLANESSITLDFHSLCFRLRKYRPNEDAAYGLIKQLSLPTCCNTSLYAWYHRKTLHAYRHSWRMVNIVSFPCRWSFCSSFYVWLIFYASKRILVIFMGKRVIIRF